MTSPCIRCGAPTDATICRPEARTLADELLTAAGHAEDAEATITRQARFGSGGGRTNEDPLPGDFTASAKLAPIRAAICGWAWVIVQQTGRQPRWKLTEGPLCPPTGRPCAHDSCAVVRRRQPPNDIARDAAWLARQVEQLRRHPAAAQAFAELEHACERLAELVDAPPRKRLVGVCDCGRILYAPIGRTVVRCRERTCGATWNVADGQDILMRHLDDKLMTAGEAARLAAYLDADRTQEQIRALIGRWARRAQLVAHGYVMRDPTAAELDEDPEAGPVTVPTYRFGEVREQLARTPRRNREGAAA